MRRMSERVEETKKNNDKRLDPEMEFMKKMC
jgi:hypothetical protein